LFIKFTSSIIFIPMRIYPNIFSIVFAII
jgi:hypothetical protein